MKDVITLKDLRLNMKKYINAIKNGRSFTVIKQSKPVFIVKPVEDDQWETVVDFTKIKKGGVPIDKVLKVLNSIKD